MPDLPVVGKVPAGWVIAVGAISVGVLGYAWYKHKQNAAAAATATTAPSASTTASTGDAYPPDGTYGNPSDPYSTDPQTGMTYGDESLYGGGGYGTSGFGPGGGYPGGTGGTGGSQPGPPFTSNAAWASYAESQLSGIVDPVALSAALGVYLTGRPASTDQVSLIDQAIAIAGYPPVAGPNNQPPGINQSGGPGPGGGVGPLTGLHATPTHGGFTASWNAAANATGYLVDVTTHQASQQVTSQTVTGTTFSLSGLHRGQSYAVHVTPQPGGTEVTTYVTPQ